MTYGVLEKIELFQNPMIIYSVRKFFTGLAKAALMA